MRISTVKKILLGLTAFSLFTTPAQASEITDKDGNSLINADDKIHNLYAQSLDGTTARSTYDKFSLDENQIANMHFNQKGGKFFATDLINVVNNRIDINGTVNAIRNGAIDGNLFFLSPEGIAIGKTGVINAGAFTAQSDGGSVDIQGKINARNNISLIGQSITVNGATLNAKTDIDFSTLVNAGDTVNNIADLKMTVDPSGSGDIIIRAESTKTLDVTGAGVRANADNDTTQTNIKNATLNAAGDITVETTATRNFNSRANNKDSVNVQAIMINAGVGDLDSAYAQKLINESDYEAPTATGGVFTEIANSTLTAGGNVKINTVEQNNVTLVNGRQSTIGATVIAVNNNAKTLLDRATVNGKSVEISAAQSGDGINSKVSEVGVGMAEIGIGYNAVKRGGETLVKLRGSNITATNGDIDIRAEDNFNVTLSNTAAKTAAVGTPSTVGKSTNNTSTRVLIESLSGIADNLSATGNININAVDNATANVNVGSTSNTTANAIDNSIANVTVKDGGHVFKGETVNLSADYNPAVVANIPNGYRSNEKSALTSNAALGGSSTVEVAGGNTFNTSAVNYTANSGAEDKNGVDAQLRSVNPAVDDAFNVANINTSTTTAVKVGNQTYDADANVTVDSVSQIGRSAVVNGTSTRDKASVNAADIVTANVGKSGVQQSVGNLTVNVVENGRNPSKALENISNITVGATIGGKWAVDEAVNISATSNDNIQSNITNAPASPVNTDGGTTTVTIAKDADISAQSFNASARSNFSIDDSIDNVSNSITVDKKTFIDVNAGAKVETKNNQSLTVLSDGKVNNKVIADNLRADSTVNVDNEVRIAKDANLNSGDNITLKANDLLTLASFTNTDTYASTSVGNTVNRKNLVDVKGNVDAVDNVNVEAGGTDTLYSDNDKQIDISAVTRSTTDYSLVEHNTVNVDGVLTGGGDINIRADSGNVGFSSNAIKVNTAPEKNNSIAVNGSVTAGSRIEGITVDISGQIIPENYNIRGTDNNGELTVTSNIGIGYNTGDEQYAKDLGDRLTALGELIKQYSTGEKDSTKKTAALAGFMTEQERILDKMRKLKLVRNEGHNSSGKIDGIDISYIELDSISTSGGNLNLTTENVTGAGTLSANSAPSVTITNRSNAYLRINDITIGASDGVVHLNGNSAMPGDAGMASSLTVKSTESTGAGKITILNDPNTDTLVKADKNDPTIYEDYNPIPDMRLLGAIENPYGDIQITNLNGDIDIAAEYVQDESGRLVAEKTATVNGRNVLIEANGDLNQGYVETLVNIGGDPPEGWYAEETAAAQAEATKKLDKEAESDTYEATIVKDVSFSSNGGRISGDNVYLAALDINVNGVIQAGFDSYIVDVNPDDIQDNQYVGKSGAVYNADKGYYDYYVPVTYSDGRLVTDNIRTGGGTIYLSGQIASTGNGRIFAANGLANINIANNTDLPLEVGEVINNQRSGKIVISDTGSDRWAEYTPGQTRYLDNYSVLVQRYTVDAETRNSLIRISPNDLDKEFGYYTPAPGMRYNWTTGTTTSTRTQYYTEGKDFGAGSWVQAVMEFLFDEEIGGTISLSRENLEKYESTMDATVTVLKDLKLPSGTFLGIGYNTDDDLDIRAESRMMFHTGPIVTHNYYWDIDTYLVKYAEWNYGWKYEDGSHQAYTFNINAAHPIKFGFIGDKHDSISIASNNDVYLTGNIKSGDPQALLSVVSNNGGIRQVENTFLNTNNAFLRANNAIRDINIQSIGLINDDGVYTDQVNLDVRAAGNGDIDINVQGGSLNGHRLPGNVFFAPIINQSEDGSKSGNVSLTASGSVTGLMSALGKSAPINTPDVVANDIKLTSLDSTVGTYGKPLKLDAAGVVDVNAYGDIAIGSAFDKTLTIGQITSDNGDVYINRRGDNAKIAQSADYKPGVDEVNNTALIHSWIDSGLIAPTDDYEGAYVGKLKAAVNDYADSISGEYQTYADGKDDYEALKSTVATEYNEYLSVKDTYQDYFDEVDENFEDYREASKAIRERIKTDFATMINYRSKGNLTESQTAVLNELETKFRGFDSAEAYYIVNAANELVRAEIEEDFSTWELYAEEEDLDDEDQAIFDALDAKFNGFDSAEAYFNAHAADELKDKVWLPFIGYDKVEDYIATTHQGQLMTTYSAFASADDYIKTTEGYALEQKYGAYPTLEAFLNSDEHYRELVSARDNVTFPYTQEELLAQEALKNEAGSYNITSNHLYIDNRKLR